MIASGQIYKKGANFSKLTTILIKRSNLFTNFNICNLLVFEALP